MRKASFLCLSGLAAAALEAHLGHGDVRFEAEECDGLDNDCNGLVDDGGVCVECPAACVEAMEEFRAQRDQPLRFSSVGRTPPRDYRPLAAQESKSAREIPHLLR